MAITENRTLIEKADLALADLTAGGGILQEEKAAQFIRLLIEQAVMLSLTTVKSMGSHTQIFPKAQFSGRVLNPGFEATALPSAQRSKPTFDSITLNTHLVKGETRLTNEQLEDNIESGNLRETVMQMLTERIGLDIEEMLIKGDTASSDPLLALFDGMLKAASSHVVDVADTTTNKSHFRDMLKAMPVAYRRNLKDLRYLTSTNSELMYRDSLSDRIGQRADDLIEGASSVAYNGIPVMGVPMFPENIGTGSHCTDHMLLDPKNAHVGVWRQIRIETDKLVQEGVIVIVATMRFGFSYLHEPAVVKAINVKIS